MRSRPSYTGSLYEYSVTAFTATGAGKLLVVVVRVTTCMTCGVSDCHAFPSMGPVQPDDACREHRARSTVLAYSSVVVAPRPLRIVRSSPGRWPESRSTYTTSLFVTQTMSSTPDPFMSANMILLLDGSR